MLCYCCLCNYESNVACPRLAWLQAMTSVEPMSKRGERNVEPLGERNVEPLGERKNNNRCNKCKSKQCDKCVTDKTHCLICNKICYICHRNINDGGVWMETCERCNLSICRDCDDNYKCPLCVYNKKMLTHYVKDVLISDVAGIVMSYL
jgi:hypothetical protein